MALLRTSLQISSRLPFADPRQKAVSGLVARCREMLANGIGCCDDKAKLGAKLYSALSPFLEYPRWARYPEQAALLAGIFADYVGRGYIRVDAPCEPHSADLPLEQAVTRSSIPTLVVLIENGADETKVHGGDLLAFIGTHGDLAIGNEMTAAAAEALMRRRMSQSTTAAAVGTGAAPGRRRLSV
jgi:hypothetical protein